MIKSRQVSLIVDYLQKRGIDCELHDIVSYVDSSLTYSENLTNITSILNVSDDEPTSLNQLTPEEAQLAIDNYQAGFKECIWDAAEAGDPDALDEIESKQLVKGGKVKKVKSTQHLKSSSIIRQHKPVSTGALHKKYGAFDCETEGLFGKARLICLVLNNGSRLSFTGDGCINQFINEITRFKYKGYKFYAHNLSFDLEKTFGREFGNSLDNKRFKLMLNGSKLISASYMLGKKDSIELLDTINLMNETLEKIGIDLGFPKLKIGEKWLTGEPVDEITKDDITYCLRDCDIVMKILDVYNEMLTPFDIKIKRTIASNAKAVWKAMHLKDRGMFVNEIKDEVFRQSYFGGRVEVFKRRYEKRRLYHYDINSLYPFVMENNKYPNPDKLKYTNDLFAALKDREGCAKITVSVSEDLYFPVLPLKENKLTFEVGELTGVYNFPEIRLAIAKGYKILDCEWVLSSEPIDSPFKDYVAYFKERKITHKKDEMDALALLDKLMLNSLYGKFAQRQDAEDRYTKDEPDFGCSYQEVGENTYRLKNVDKKRSGETVVCWSSYVASYARVVLYNYLKPGTYYADTDSVFTTQELPSELVDDYEFGLMALEHLVNESYFVAPKRYAIKTSEGEIIKKIKGVHKDAVAYIPLETFGADVGVFYDKPVKMITGILKGVAPYSRERVHKQLRYKNDKRDFDNDGNSKPLIHYNQ